MPEGFTRKKYPQALIAINRSISINSNRQRYNELKLRIIRRSEQYKKNQAAINKYFSFIDRINLFNLFLENKRMKHFENISYVKNNFSFIDPASFSADPHRKKYSMHGAEASVFWHFPMPYLPAFSENASLQLTTIGSVFMSGTNSEKTGMLGADRSLDTALLYNLGFSVAGGPTIRYLSYYFGIGVGIETGYLLFSEKQDPLFTTADADSDTDSYFRLGIGFELWLAWMPFEDLHIFLRWRTIKMGIWGSSDDRTQYKFSSLSVGAGYRVF